MNDLETAMAFKDLQMEYEKTLEEKVINQFFIREKRERIKSFLRNSKRRSDFTCSLAHCNDLRFEKFIEINGPNEAQQIKDYITKIGKVKSCYIISENEDIDGKRIDIELALNETVGHCYGTLLIFGDAQIVYFEGESPNDRWISKYKL